MLKREAPPVSYQIAAAADYYEPAVYAFGANRSGGLPALLSFYKSLDVVADPASPGYVPMSAVERRGRNPKLFAVGILPPGVGRGEGPLDRSAVISNFTGEARTEDAAAEIARADVEERRVPREISTAGARAIAKFEGIRYKAYKDAVGKWTIGVGHTGPEVVEGLVWTPEQVEAAFLVDLDRFESAVSKAVTVPVTQGEYDAMVSLAFNIGGAGFAKSTLVRKLNAGDRRGASAEFAAFNKITLDGKKVVHGGLVQRRKTERQMFERAVLESAKPSPLMADADSAEFGAWGSQNGNSFREGLARQSDLQQIDYQASELGYRKALKASLAAMQNAPPLRLLVNPNSFSLKSQKIVNDGNVGRNGPIIEFWGDDQDKISGSGQVAAFYALDAVPGLGRGGPGLSRHARNMSLAWQNFQSLYLLYRNNGGMYLPDMNQKDRDLFLAAVGSVYIYYDGTLYIGCFDSFNVREADMKPFTVEYDFEFTVRASFLLDSPSEEAVRRQHTAGLPTRLDLSRPPNAADERTYGDSVINSRSAQTALNAAGDFLRDVAGVG